MTAQHTLTAAAYRYGIKVKQTEEQICIEFLRLVNLAIQTGYAAPELRPLHIPNGQRSGKVQGAIHGAKDRKLGARRGTFDYILGWRADTGCKFGWLEAKSRTGRMSEEQKEFMEWLERIGAPRGVFRSSEQGIAALVEWGAIRPCFLADWIGH